MLCYIVVYPPHCFQWGKPHTESWTLSLFFILVFTLCTTVRYYFAHSPFKVSLNKIAFSDKPVYYTADFSKHYDVYLVYSKVFTLGLRRECEFLSCLLHLAQINTFILS